MTHAFIGLVVAALGMVLIWRATRFRTTQARRWTRLAPVVFSVAGVLAVLIGFRVAFGV